MKKLFIVLAIALLVFAVAAREIALRQSDDLKLEQFSFKAADGSRIIFWSDITSGHRDIYCQKINSEGQILWGEPIPIVTKPGDQSLIGVTASSDNNFIMLWADYDIQTTLSLSVQKVTSNGQRLWGENGIQVSDTQMSYPTSHIVANGIGGAFIVYLSEYGGPVFGQNFDGYGNRLWPSTGLSLVESETSLGLRDAVTDGAGGFILNIGYWLNPGWQNKLTRFDASGTQTGNNPLIPVNTIPGGLSRLLPPVNGQYLIYNQPEDPNRNIHLNKLDAEGNLYLPQSAVYTLSGPDYVDFRQLVSAPDGGVVISWLGGSWGANSNLYVQKLSTQLNPVWPQPTVVYEGESVAYGTYLAPVSDGKVWISWRGDWENQYNRAQVLSPEGTPLWEAGGKLLANQSSAAMCFANANKGVFWWENHDAGYIKVQLQAISVNGALSYPAGGFSLQQKLKGNCSIIGTYALGDRWLTLWLDNRENNCIYYQLLNQNMEPLLEPNGRRLNYTSEGYSDFKACTVTPDGKLALIYGHQTYLPDQTVYSTWLQMIDSNGELFYPGCGFALPGDSNFEISSSGDAIYVGWTEFNVGPVHQVMGQKFVNGTPMWGPEGKLIASAPLIYGINLMEIAGPYYLWSINSPDQTRNFCRVLRLDGNGDPALGWPAEGMDIIEDNCYLNQEFSEIGRVGDDLVAFLRLYKTGSYGTRIQRINPLGERLWGSGGHSVSGTDQWLIINDVVFGEDLYFITTASIDDQRLISFRHVNSAGQELTQPAGTEIVPATNNVYDASLVRFASGSFLCAYSDNDGAWLQNRDVFIRQLSPDGSVLGDAPVLLCGERYQQDHVSMAAIGNRAFIAWGDDRAGIMNSEEAWTGIWGNMVTSAFTPNDDPQLSPHAQPVIDGNYPNPFNPSTSIGFSIPVSAPVSLAVYNLKGQLVRTLLSNTDLSSGKHSVIWDGLDDKGRGVSSGVYFCRLSCGSTQVSRKMLLAK